MASQKYFILFIVCILLSCKGKSTDPEQIITPIFTSESSKCIPVALARGSASSSDSLFSYSFTQSLVVDFSAHGNCCPDSNRFMVGHEIRNDTILIAVSDTARNLCRCICFYMIHVQVTDLPLDRYVIRCCLADGNSTLDPLHLVTVVRH
jgi:hypothetical protein